ncbi:MAG: alpha-L-fucosidase [Planctomycetota bacterium]
MSLIQQSILVSLIAKREILNRATVVFFLLSLMAGEIMAQHHESDYIPPTEPEVLKKLDAWQDLKFGLLMHWGPYSQWGVVESWSICDEDWITRDKGRFENYADYKEDYENLQKTFNPARFAPKKWVKAARAAGMKYMVFTTKHHDGFSMFDTKQTDYRITSKACPFHTHPEADITKALFQAFRSEGFWVGAYFSKPDWHCKDYWWPYHSTPDRHVNYDPARHPEKWQSYKDFTFAQIEELMTGYGPVDILWLDGAWVRPVENMPEEFKDWAMKKNYNQDVDMPRIVAMARKHQPGLIVVDRWVSSEFENYLTPEQKIPDEALTVPWESCITMAPGWSYHADHKYKPVRQLIHMLADIVCKGGNFLLNIGPSPEGDWDGQAYDRLEGIGKWMEVNHEAIYATRPLPPYKDGKICLTRRKDGSIFAIYLAEEGENRPPSELLLHSIHPAPGSTLTLLGSSEEPLEWQWHAETGSVAILIPESMRASPPCEHAWTIRISAP